MQNNDTYIKQLCDKLQEINPYMVLLFGSYAYGSPHQDSDIDLLVVTNDNYIPKDFNEHTQIYLKVSSAIRPIKE